jgi:hypothetical protein
MRAKFALAGLVLVVALTGGRMAQADDEPKAAPKGNWFTRLFVSEKKEPDPKKIEVKKEPGPSLEELHARAKSELLRRQLICVRLREIAEETHDAELQRKADQLDQRAFEIYLEKTGAPSRTPVMLPEDEAFPRPRSGAAAPAARATNNRPSREDMP